MEIRHLQAQELSRYVTGTSWLRYEHPNRKYTPLYIDGTNAYFFSKTTYTFQATISLTKCKNRLVVLVDYYKANQHDILTYNQCPCTNLLQPDCLTEYHYSKSAWLLLDICITVKLNYQYIMVSIRRASLYRPSFNSEFLLISSSQFNVFARKNIPS